MLSRRRLITRGLRIEDLNDDLVNREMQCSGCNREVELFYQFMPDGRKFCKQCSPFYKERKVQDELDLEEDLLRGPGHTLE